VAGRGPRPRLDDLCRIARPPNAAVRGRGVPPGRRPTGTDRPAAGRLSRGRNDMSRLRVLPWVVGVVLLACTLVGANRLFHPDDGTSPGGGGAAPKNGKPNGPALTGGTIAIGSVDSVPSPVRIGPPSVSALATVAKVFPKEGTEVKPGDDLVQFDDAIYQ